jgi:hypothetical protein
MAVLSRGAPALLLAGCASPISNTPFAEEAAFLAALPDARTWLAPLDVARAPVGDDPVLFAAKEAAGSWDGWVEGPVTLGEALRAREPDERTDVARRWSGVEVIANYTGAVLSAPEPRRLWVDGEVVRLEDGSYRASVAVAPAADVPGVEVGVGQRAGAGGSARWDLDALFAAYGVAVAPGPLALDVRGEDEFARRLDGTVGDGPGASEWTLDGSTTIGFSADLAITRDGATWPAAIEATVQADDGGRAEGVLATGGGGTAFEACWDGAGNTTWLGGDAGIARTGEPGVCVSP